MLPIIGIYILFAHLDMCYYYDNSVITMIIVLLL